MPKNKGKKQGHVEFNRTTVAQMRSLLAEMGQLRITTAAVPAISNGSVNWLFASLRAAIERLIAMENNLERARVILSQERSRREQAEHDLANAGIALQKAKSFEDDTRSTYFLLHNILESLLADHLSGGQVSMAFTQDRVNDYNTRVRSALSLLKQPGQE